jgi:uncharacterized protein DUF3850
MTHYMKSYPAYFQATILKQKTHELRKNDFGVEDGMKFSVGDTICLEEFDPVHNQYTGRTAELCITYISPGPKPWLMPGYTLMSTRLKDPTRWYHKYLPFLTK